MAALSSFLSGVVLLPSAEPAGAPETEWISLSEPEPKPSPPPPLGVSPVSELVDAAISMLTLFEPWLSGVLCALCSGAATFDFHRFRT
ncbi:hypothetical protein B0T17DRAFT_513028 [Bombardia bombarda]|uniref:Secreted protein n=1 Tax=Bombardia bombarda TaxID=252184 RepID=A0AA40CED0_9PEZI|nr:hypothetical protein B0T17DRAFT_513028 [Bombardia bombarda]